MVVEIPIEIRVKESEEIDRKIKEIQEADKNFKALPKKGKSKSSTSQAVPTLDTSSKGGLEEAGIQVLPTRGRKDPLGLKNKRNKNGVVTRRELDKILSDRLGNAENILNLLQGKGGGAIGQLTGFVTKIAPPIAIALLSIGFAEKVIKIAFGPGGPFDVRFNEFEERTKKLFSTRDQALKRQGEKTVRITSFYGSRGGRDTTFTTLDPIRKGQYVFDRDLNLLSKGVTQ